MPATPPGLEVTRPRSARLLWALPVVALAGAFAWYASHPAPLPPTGPTASTSAPAEVPVYVGMLGPTERELVLRGISLDVEGGSAVALVCRSGSVGVTEDAESFCDALDPAEGRTLLPGDQLVLEVSGPAGAAVTVTAPRVSFREGAQWGHGTTGRPVALSVLP